MYALSRETEAHVRKRPRGDSLVPVGLGVAVQRWEHDGQDLGGVVTDQAHDVLIVPVIQSSFCHLTTHWFITQLRM